MLTARPAFANSNALSSTIKKLKVAQFLGRKIKTNIYSVGQALSKVSADKKKLKSLVRLLR